MQKHFLRRRLGAMVAATFFATGALGITWGGSVEAAEAVAHIGQVQGASHQSPYTGKDVEIKGTVTFREGPSTFFIQDEGDGDDKTSDGILVYAPDASCGIGDIIKVSGEVKEYYGKGYREKKQTDLTITEIAADKIKVLGHTSTLPKPIVLDKDRMIPRKVIDSDGMKVFNPDHDALDFWESIEGMRVSVENPKVLGPQRYGEIWVVPGNNPGPFNNSGGQSITGDDMHPEHIDLALQGGNAKSFVTKSGDYFDGTVTGVVSYGFGVYKVLTMANKLPQLVDGGLKPEKAQLTPAQDKLLLASYNIENFSANPSFTPDSKVKRLAQSIKNDLKMPDILTVLELQDNDGKTDSGTADASKSAQRLIDAVKAESGVTYNFVNINPEYNKDGGQPGANIRVAFFYNPNRVTLKSGAPMGTSSKAVGWKDGHLTLNPGRIDPTNPIYDYTRKPLAAEFEFQGKNVVVVANHLNSKRGDDPLYGQHQPVRLRSEEKRLQLAENIKAFVEEGIKQNPNLNIVLTGDFNDFEFSPVIKKLEGSDMVNLVGRHDIADRYAYFYQGNSQVLDNIIVSKNLAQNAKFDIVHVNSSFMVEHGRVSDHDPLEVQLTLN